jgi:hypothetical protein
MVPRKVPNTLGSMDKLASSVERATVKCMWECLFCVMQVFLGLTELEVSAHGL